MGWQALPLLGVLLGLLASSAAPLVLLPAHLRRVRRRRDGRFSVLLLLYAGFFFLPSVPNALLTLGEIGDLLAGRTADRWFGEFLLAYVVLYADFWFLWLLAALAAVLLGYLVARPPRAAHA